MLWDWVFSKLLTPNNVGALAVAGAFIAAAAAARLLTLVRVPVWLARLGAVVVAAAIIGSYITQVMTTLGGAKASAEAAWDRARSSTQELSSAAAPAASPCDRLTAEQVASLLYVAGFRGDDLVHLLAIGKRESGYKPAAHRSDKDKSRVIGDRGLFQINYIHDSRLKAAGIITQATDLFDPLVNARAAWFLFAEQGLFPWNMTAGGWQANGVPFHATNVDAARVAVERAGQQGLLTGDLAEYERQTAACATEVK